MREDVFSKAYWPFDAVMVAYPRRDMIRIWLLSVVDARFEDWWDGMGETMMNE